MACALGQLEQEGLIDALRIGGIRPLITGDAMAKQNPGRQRQHLLDQGRSTAAGGTGTEPIPGQPVFNDTGEPNASTVRGVWRHEVPDELELLCTELRRPANWWNQSLIEMAK